MSNLVQETFGFTSIPFTQDIKVEVLYRSESFSSNLERLKYAVDHKLFTVLISEPGCGKSTMLRTLRDTLSPSRHLFLYISESKLTPRWLYNQILRQLGAREYYYRGDGKKAVHEQLAIVKEVQRKDIVVCVDEAHLLSIDTLQELRFFLNNDIDSHSPVSLILSGQTELKDTLQRKSCEAIKQRIAYPVLLEPMTREQTERYITAHLNAVGCNNEIFSFEAIDVIYAKSTGVARIINQICSLSLMAAASISQDIVSAEIVRNVIQTEMI